MTPEQLRAEHPDVYEAVLQQGIAMERDRVNAHLEMGEVSGDFRTAHASVRSGVDMSTNLVATYMRMAINKRDRDVRQEESNAASAVLDGALASDDVVSEDLGDQIVAFRRARRGLAADGGPR